VANNAASGKTGISAPPQVSRSACHADGVERQPQPLARIPLSTAIGSGLLIPSPKGILARWGPSCAKAYTAHPSGLLPNAPRQRARKLTGWRWRRRQREQRRAGKLQWRRRWRWRRRVGRCTVRPGGGSLTIAGAFSVNGSSVAGGAAGAGGAGLGGVGNGTAGTGGSAFGSGIFLQGNGTITFQPGSGVKQTISDSIADQSGSGGTGANTGSWALSVSGGGSLVLDGANSYSAAPR
jgi:hypothetical protein